MDIEAAEARGVEDRLGQDQSIGDDNRGVGIESAEALLLLGTLKPFWCCNGQVCLFSRLVHRRLAQGHAAAGCARRLGIDGNDLVAGFEDRAKRRHGEVGRAHEDDAQGRHGPLCHCGRLCRNQGFSLYKPQTATSALKEAIRKSTEKTPSPTFQPSSLATS